jgi:hypothetical protein
MKYLEETPKRKEAQGKHENYKYLSKDSCPKVKSFKEKNSFSSPIVRSRSSKH